MRGAYQIMVATRPAGRADRADHGPRQQRGSELGAGRPHIVYTSVGDGAPGPVYYRRRDEDAALLAPGGNLRMAEWSPPLLRASDLVLSQ
jgi:hypothetical protein